MMLNNKLQGHYRIFGFVIKSEQFEERKLFSVINIVQKPKEQKYGIETRPLDPQDGT